jgi:MFS transporter, DHA1 family, inner membrane transport protein
LTTANTSQSAGRTEITRLLSVILVSRLVINTSFRIGYAFVPELSRGLGIELPAMGALISTRSFAGMLAPVFGSLSDRYGRRPLMFGSLVLLIACAALAYLSASFVFFAIGFVGLGIAKVIFDPSCSAFLGDRVPYARRGLVLGLSELGWASGGLIGVPIAARAIALWGWQSPYALIALGGAAALVWAALALPKTDTVHHTQHVDTRAAFAAVAHHRSAVIMLCVVASFMIAGELIAISYATWLTVRFQLDVMALGGIVATFAAADVGGEVLSMLAVDRFGKKRALLAGYCATTLFYFTMPALGASLPVAVAALFLYYVCFEFTIVSVFPLVSELAPEARGTILSLTILAASVGRTIGGLSGAWLFALSGFGANGITAGLVVAAATVLFAFGVRERG